MKKIDGFEIFIKMTDILLVVATIAAATWVLMSFGGCSYYSQDYTETRQGADGSPVTFGVETTNIVPPLGKDASAGSVTAGVGESGAWEFDMRHQAQTDNTQQQGLIDGLVQAYTGQAQQNAQLQQQNQLLRRQMQQMQQQLNQLSQRGAAPQ